MARVTDDSGNDGQGRRGVPEWRRREEATRARGVILRPGDEAGVFPTAYQSDVLLIAPPRKRKDGAEDKGGQDDAPLEEDLTQEGVISQLGALAAVFGWSVVQEPLEDPVEMPDRRPASETESEVRRRNGARALFARDPGAAGTVRARIALIEKPAEAETPEGSEARIAEAATLPRPDAFTLLRAARRARLPGVTLNHVMTVDAGGYAANPFTGNPFTGNPFTGNPFTGNPFTGNPFTGNPAGLAGYAYPGTGGRQPITYTGPDLPAPGQGWRPVVAVLDTGCSEVHKWFKGKDVLEPPFFGNGEPIGIFDPSTDPERVPSQCNPRDGVIDRAAGHGTFIAGIVRQACPQARILPVRVSDSNGTILENELLGALGRIAKLLEEGEMQIDVLNLSLSYYDEAPGGFGSESSSSQKTLGELYELLTRIRTKDCIVVCSAGNDATERPSSPAALYAWPGCEFGITPEEEKGLAPQVAVGALNPSGHSIALYSNIGSWVTTYARGTSVVSSIPTFQGGAQADLRDDWVPDGAARRCRETLDIDDFRSEFAVWSGTSFAAPLVAGRIAAALATAHDAGIAKTSTDWLTAVVNEVVAAVDEEDYSATP